ncbi:MAG: twin-arginine translocase TatA/TatE family subunit [Bacteroidaceae bacterium]|nr:twin-arginine translocase TatA/TatE family subunit [Bacteroidaceae bacterium]
MIQPLFIGTTELLLISGVALLLFGGKKLPEMMRGLGKGVKEFKEGMNEITNPESTAPKEKDNPKDTEEKETTAHNA